MNKDFLLSTRSLNFENATHYILNYQFILNNRILRIETYLKDYHHLLSYKKDQQEYTLLSNEGYGYAGGIDLFWRDKVTFKNTDYWISYSYIESKRKYRDYPVSATPPFVSKHNLSVVLKYWLDFADTQISTSYVFRSGRTFYNPNSVDFLTNRLKPFNDLSLSLSYLTRIAGNFTIVHVSCSNILGFKNINGYNFENNPDDSGNYRAHPAYPYSTRTFIIGIFISVK